MRISDWSSDVCSSDLLRPMIIGRPIVSALKRLRSAGRCHGNFPSRPITPFSARASTSVIILRPARSEEHTSELQSLMRISYAVFCLKKKNYIIEHTGGHSTKTQYQS